MLDYRGRSVQWPQGDAVSFPESEQELAWWLEEIIWDVVHGTEGSGLRISLLTEAGVLTVGWGWYSGSRTGRGSS